MAARCALDLPLSTVPCSLCFPACDRHPSRGFGSRRGGGKVDPYADNGPGADGEVRCRGCRLPFPGLDALAAAGLDRYPVRCRECRAGRPGVAVDAWTR